jgi:hypothetical protein
MKLMIPVMLGSGPKQRTSNLNATITDLEACENYMFAVGVIGPLGLGPLSELLVASTRFNVSAAPKNLEVSSHPQNETIMNIHWHSSCPAMIDKIGYTVCGFLCSYMSYVTSS